MQNILINVCEKFHYDRLRNDRALGDGKSDNNKKNNNNMNVGSSWRPVSGSKTDQTSVNISVFISLYPISCNNATQLTYKPSP